MLLSKTVCTDKHNVETRINTVTYLRCAGGGRTPEGFHGRKVLRFKRRRCASTGVGVSGEPLKHLPGGAERSRNTYCARRERDVTCHPTEVTLKRIFARTSTVRLRLMHHKKRKLDALHLNICIILKSPTVTSFTWSLVALSLFPKQLH